MRWRKRDRWRPSEGFELVRDGVVLAVVSMTKGAWYWYTLHDFVEHKNTANDPTAEADAKRDAMQWCRVHRKASAS